MRDQGHVTIFFGFANLHNIVETGEASLEISNLIRRLIVVTGECQRTSTSDLFDYLFKFSEISDNISETVRDSDRVTTED